MNVYGMEPYDIKVCVAFFFFFFGTFGPDTWPKYGGHLDSRFFWLPDRSHSTDPNVDHFR